METVLNYQVLKQTGIYIAYPTTPELKSIYRPKNYKTMVNDQHTKIGIAKDSFNSRAKGYYGNFDNEVVFIPLVIIDIKHLELIEKTILSEIKTEFARVGRAREWFNTINRERIIEIVFCTLKLSGIEYERIS
jgi:hypothetical protein